MTFFFLLLFSCQSEEYDQSLQAPGFCYILIPSQAASKSQTARVKQQGKALYKPTGFIHPQKALQVRSG